MPRAGVEPAFSCGPDRGPRSIGYQIGASQSASQSQHRASANSATWAYAGVAGLPTVRSSGCEVRYGNSRSCTHASMYSLFRW